MIIDGQLLIVVSSKFDFEELRRHLTARKQCSWPISEQKDTERQIGESNREHMPFGALGNLMLPFSSRKGFYLHYER